MRRLVRVRASRGSPAFTLENQTGYATEDLAEVFRRAFAYYRVRTPKRVLVTSSPIRTRGCAQVRKDASGSRIVVAIASPSKLSMGKLGRIVRHEIAHALGLEHERMPEKLLYSEGDAPRWTRGIRLRYYGRAPNQMSRLQHGTGSLSRRSPSASQARSRARTSRRSRPR